MKQLLLMEEHSAIVTLSTTKEGRVVPPSLIAHSIEKQFNNKNILCDINLTIGSKNLIILGENGVGKSLLLNMLSGTLAPSKGRVSLSYSQHYDDIAADAEARGYIGYQSDYLGLWPQLTVNESLQFLSSIMHNHFTSIDELIKKFRLSSVANQTVKYLSDGYKKRLNLAIALSGERPFTLLDEPTNTLDPLECQFFIELIKEKSQTSTIVMATHRIEEAIEIGGEAIILYRQNIAYRHPVSATLKEDYYALHQ